MEEETQDVFKAYFLPKTFFIFSWNPIFFIDYVERVPRQREENPHWLLTFTELFTFVWSFILSHLFPYINWRVYEFPRNVSSSARYFARSKSFKKIPWKALDLQRCYVDGQRSNKDYFPTRIKRFAESVCCCWYNCWAFLLRSELAFQGKYSHICCWRTLNELILLNTWNSSFLRHLTLKLILTISLEDERDETKTSSGSNSLSSSCWLSNKRNFLFRKSFADVCFPAWFTA